MTPDDDREALDILRLDQQVYATEVEIDLINQTLWVHSGHTLKDGSLSPKTPKTRYFTNQGGKP